MAKVRITSKYVGARVEADLATKFLSLAHSKGISMNEAYRRLMVDAVQQNRIPGVENMDLEVRESEKWGTAATPVYSGEEELQGAEKKTP